MPVTQVWQSASIASSRMVEQDGFVVVGYVDQTVSIASSRVLDAGHRVTMARPTPAVQAFSGQSLTLGIGFSGMGGS